MRLKLERRGTTSAMNSDVVQHSAMNSDILETRLYAACER